MDSGHNTGNGGDAQGIYSGGLGDDANNGVGDVSNVLAQEPIVSSGMDNDVVSQQPVVSSGVGDVMLPAMPEKKRRWPIVVAIVAVLVMVGVGALIGKIVMPLTAEQVIDNYQKYFNYLVYGQEATSIVSGSDYQLEDSAVMAAFQNGDVNYFKKLEDYYDVFYDEYSGLLSGSYGEEMVEDNKEILSFVVALNIVRPLDEHVLIDEYAEGKTLADYEDEKMHVFENISEDASEYVKYRIDFADVYQNYLSMISDMGCFSGEIDWDCVFGSKPTEDYNRILEELDEKLYSIRIIEDNVVDNLLNYGWGIQGVLSLDGEEYEG